jgi:hypothetical protein
MLVLYTVTDRAFEAPRLQRNPTTNMCGSGPNCEKLDASSNTAGYIVLLLVLWIASQNQQFVHGSFQFPAVAAEM